MTVNFALKTNTHTHVDTGSHAFKFAQRYSRADRRDGNETDSGRDIRENISIESGLNPDRQTVKRSNR